MIKSFNKVVTQYQKNALKEHIRFIINPISGVGRKNKIPNLIEKHLDHTRFDYDIVYTQYKHHAKKISSEAARSDIPIICAVGGDGSVNEVGTALIGTSSRLAIIPSGSGNGLARHLHIPLDIKKAIHCINDSKSIVVDTVQVNNQTFIGTAGYGFDAIIAKKFDQHNKRGFLSYVYLTIREFIRYKPISVTIKVKDRIETLSIVLLTIANSSQFGNGFTVSPESKMNDGQIELVVLKPFSRWLIPSVVFRFFTKKHQRARHSEIISFQRAQILTASNLAHYDGEPATVASELNVHVIPQSLNIIVGKKAQ